MASKRTDSSRFAGFGQDGGRTGVVSDPSSTGPAAQLSLAANSLKSGKLSVSVIARIVVIATGEFDEHAKAHCASASACCHRTRSAPA